MKAIRKKNDFQKIFDQFLSKFRFSYSTNEEKIESKTCEWKSVSNSLLTIRCKESSSNVFALCATITQNEPYKIGFDRRTDGSAREEIDAGSLEADQLLVRALTRQ